MEDYKITSNNDEREILSLSGHCKSLQHDIEMMKEQLENNSDLILDLKRQLTKAIAESKMWKTKYESDALSKMEEIDDQNSKLKAMLSKVEQEKETSTFKYETLKKCKQQLISEIKVVKADLENYKSSKSGLEKKIDENTEQIGRQKNDLKTAHEQLVQTESEIKSYSTELVKLRTVNDNLSESVNYHKQENINLESKFQKMNEQNETLNKTINEIEQSKRRIESEKDDLILAIEDLECALEKADARAINLNEKVNKLKVDYNNSIEEMEIEMRNSKQDLQNTLVVAQSDLEIVRKAQSDNLRLNQKLQNNISDLESSLDHSNRCHIEYILHNNYLDI